jgi:glycosyltransferase involved in cell wall biosynthesis
LVSILTPTYNHAAFIDACIESVLAQDYPDWEMVVVDDGSTDGTGDRIAKYHDERINYVRQSHVGIHGLAETYRKALGHSRGEVVAFLEGDDFWPVNKLATLVPLLEDPSVVLAYGVTHVVAHDGGWHGRTIPDRELLGDLPLRNDPPGSAARALLTPQQPLFVFPVSTVVRRSALDAIGGIQSVDDGHSVDWATFLSLTLSGRFGFVDEPMGFWRRHERGSTNTWNFDVGFAEADRRFVLAFLEEHAGRLGIGDAERRAMSRAWEEFLGSMNCLRGRRLLVERDWSGARAQLALALRRTRTPRVFATSALAFAASFLHTDIEPLVPQRRI